MDARARTQRCLVVPDKVTSCLLNFKFVHGRNLARGVFRIALAVASCERMGHGSFQAGIQLAHDGHDSTAPMPYAYPRGDVDGNLDGGTNTEPTQHVGEHALDFMRRVFPTYEMESSDDDEDTNFEHDSNR